MGHLTGNPLFPYFNQYFHSPLALDRVLSRHALSSRPCLTTALLFPLLFSHRLARRRRSAFQDIRVGVAYVLVIAAVRVCASCAPSARSDCAPGCRLRRSSAFAARELYRVAQSLRDLSLHPLLEMLAPLLIAAAIGLWPCFACARVCHRRASHFARGICVSPSRPAHARAVGDPYIQVTFRRSPTPTGP